MKHSGNTQVICLPFYVPYARVKPAQTFTNLLSAFGVSADYLRFGTAEEDQSERESILQGFSILLKRGDDEDIKMIYQLAAHMMRNKPLSDSSVEFDVEFDRNDKKVGLMKLAFSLEKKSIYTLWQDM